MLAVEVAKRLDGFSLAVAFAASDAITVLFGPSGAGKSLTLQAIAGTFTPDEGCIIMDGEPVFDSARGVNVPPQRRRVGYVPQNYALFPHLTVADNIAFGLNGLGRRQSQQRVAEMVSIMGLHGLERRRPGQLSGGQQQRVALARALAFRPRLLLLDEPFASLDDTIRSALRQELLAVTERSQTATLLVTHDMAEAFTLGNRIVIIDDGRVLQEGDREEVFYRPCSRRVAELVGTRNILRATVVGCEADALYLRWQGHIIRAQPQPLPVGRDVNFCIRATQVMLVRPDRPPSAPPENRLWGRIVREAIHGENYIVYVKVEGSAQPYNLEVELPGYVYHRLGLDTDKDVEVSLKSSAIHVIPMVSQ